MRSATGIDIGGSSVRAGRVSAEGTLLARAALALDHSLPACTLRERLLAVAAEVGLGAPADPVAVAFPGFLDGQGRVAYAANLPGLNGLDLAEILSPVAGARPVRCVPDLAAAALGESRVGAGRGVERFLCVALGTGANAALVVGGRVVETAFGCLGDAGHVLVDPDGPACPCGGRGCLEAVASGFALRRDGAAHGFADARGVLEAARAGEAPAEALVARAGVALGRAVATWSALTWPDRVAVAGGLASAGELLLGPARAELARVGSPPIVGALELVLAELGAEATLVGAGLAALGPDA